VGILTFMHWVMPHASGGRILQQSGPAAPEDEDPRCVDCPHVFFGLSDQGLRLDSTGKAHLAYVGDAVYYADEDSGTWRTEIVDAAPATIYRGTYEPLAALAIDDSASPHLAYLNPSDRSVVYAHKTSSGWQKEIVVTAAPGHQINYETAIALDARGQPRIVYAEQGVLHYARRTASGWQLDPVDNAGWSEMYFSIALDLHDVPHIAYFQAFATTAHIKYATMVGTTWMTEFPDRSGFLGEFNSIAVDRSGTPHISYLDYTHSQLKYARRLGTNQWSVAVVDVSQWFGGFTSIALDRSGNPHISYTGVANEARYADWTGTTWRTRAIEPNVWYTALALDADDMPRVAYYERGERNLTYARWDGQAWVKQRVDTVAQPAHQLP
jgi:hypothetical protein